MKTHIIQLEEYDDIISARDKMGWARGERILLIWPERQAVLDRRLDLVLLQRRSAALGAQLALVTRNSDVRYYALRLGVPVFKSLRQAQNDHWRLPRRFRVYQTTPHPLQPAAPPSVENQTIASDRLPEAETTETGDNGEPGSAILDSKGDPKDKPNRLVNQDTQPEAEIPAARKPLPVRPELEPEWKLSRRQRLGVFTLGVLAVLAIAATLLPQAQITLIPQTRVQDVIIDVRAGPGILSTNLVGAVPARWTHLTVEGQATRPVSGSVRLPDQIASGQIDFSNLTDQAVTIPQGTVVRTSGAKPVRFAVTEGGSLPAGPGQKVSLPAQALAPGSEGNLPTGSLVAMEGLLGTQVSANNSQATRGGSDRMEPAATPEDRRQLAEGLHRSLEQTARQELAGRLAAGDLLLPYSLKLVETLEEEYQPPAGLPLELPADQVSLHLRLEYQVLVAAGTDLRSLSEAVFDANLPAGFIPQRDSLRWENFGTPQPGTDGNFYWQMHATRQIIAQASPEIARQVVLGITPARALQRLEQVLPLEEPPQIHMLPAWWPVLPILPFRIHLSGLEPGTNPPDSSVLVQGLGN